MKHISPGHPMRLGLSRCVLMFKFRKNGFVFNNQRLPTWPHGSFRSFSVQTKGKSAKRKLRSKLKAPTDVCCGNGCQRCVYFDYLADLEAWNTESEDESTEPRESPIEVGMDAFMRMETEIARKRKA